MKNSKLKLNFFSLSIVYMFIITCYPQILCAVEPILICYEIQKQEMESHIEFFEDKAGSLRVGDISRLKEQGRFKKLDTRQINFGYTGSVYWLFFEITNPYKKANTAILEIAKPCIDQLELFQLENGDYEQIITGDAFCFETRSVAHRYLNFELKFKSKTVHRYFLKVKSDDAIVFPLILHNPGY